MVGVVGFEPTVPGTKTLRLTNLATPLQGLWGALLSCHLEPLCLVNGWDGWI